MRNKIEKIAEKEGKSVAQLLIDRYEEFGEQTKVAESLGISQPTVSTWVARLGLKPKTVLVFNTSK